MEKLKDKLTDKIFKMGITNFEYDLPEKLTTNYFKEQYKEQEKGKK